MFYSKIKTFLKSVVKKINPRYDIPLYSVKCSDCANCIPWVIYKFITTRGGFEVEPAEIEKRQEYFCYFIILNKGVPLKLEENSSAECCNYNTFVCFNCYFCNNTKYHFIFPPYSVSK